MQDITYLDGATAARVDERLMSDGLYNVNQLMELAGLAVAEVVEKEFPMRCKVTVVCGPGNNGGDGFVAARHLAGFGYNVTVCSYREPTANHLQSMLNLLSLYNIPVVASNEPIADADVIVDALFGFSSKGAPRAPYDAPLAAMAAATAPVVAVDVPSGWIVDGEAPSTSSAGHGGAPPVAPGAPTVVPAVLVSLMAPKACARRYRGRHYVAGRFLPPAIADEFGITVAPFFGARCFLQLPDPL